MERYIVATSEGYVQEASYVSIEDTKYTDDANEALQFETLDDAWDFVDSYFTDDWDEQDKLGIYVNKLEYPDQPEVQVNLLSNEVDSLINLINKQLSNDDTGDDTASDNNSLGDLLSIAGKLLGKK